VGKSERLAATPLPPPPPPPPPPPASYRDDKENTGGHNAASRPGQRASDRGALFDQITTMNYTPKSVVADKKKAESTFAAPPPDPRQRVKAAAAHRAGGLHGPSPGTLIRSAVVYEMEARRSHLRQGIESETDDDWE